MDIDKIIKEELDKFLIEDINENILRSFKRDCSFFLSVNSEQLLDGNIIKRGTSKNYDKNIIKKSSRKRESVTGTYHNTWIYERFKPPSYPSREDMVPTQNGKLMDIFRQRDVYGVFPVGNNYKLQYTSRVRDFNSDNPYFSNYTLLSFLWNFQEDPERYNLDERHIEIVKELDDFYHANISGQYDDIVKVYDRL